MLLRFLRSQEPRVADDLSGEVWLGVASNLHRFEGDAAGFRAWLFTIARRRVAEHRRRGVRRPSVPVDPDHLHERDEPSPGGPPEPGEVLGAQEAVDRLLEGLTEDQALVVSLRVLADLDVATVAHLLDRSESWVRVTQHRALRRLAREHGADSGVTK
jgi:RNA polymerase sigma-70 factor (ECF subfamily)